MLTADQLLDFEELEESLIRELEKEIAEAYTEAVAPDNAIGRLSRMDYPNKVFAREVMMHSTALLNE